MIKVFLEDNDGNVSSIDYGLEAKNYKRVVKVEMLEETSKLKDSLNTILIDNKKPIYETRQAPEKKRPTQTGGYETFNHILHDTDKDHYWVECLCTNCFKTSQIVIKKGKPYERKILKKTSCTECRLFSTLERAKWNGHEYKVIKK